MDAHHAVVDLASVAVILPAHADGMLAALCRPRLVHAADRPGMGVIGGDDLLEPVSKFVLIPLDRFEKTLAGPRPLMEGDAKRFGRFRVKV